MKRITASAARKNWFRLLDEVVAGETVVVERNGRGVVLRRETGKRKGAAVGSVPDYSKLLRVPNADRLDRWSWEWKAPGRELVSKSSRKR